MVLENVVKMIALFVMMNTKSVNMFDNVKAVLIM